VDQVELAQTATQEIREPMEQVLHLEELEALVRRVLLVTQVTQVQLVQVLHRAVQLLPHGQVKMVLLVQRELLVQLVPEQLLEVLHPLPGLIKTE
jgi:hypothetical protein